MEQQLSFDEIEKERFLASLPGKTAYIDESGGFGFDFTKEQTPKYYILCAIIINNSELSDCHDSFLQVKKTHHLENTELKSSSISDYKRRNRIMSDLLQLNFNIILLVANKEAFVKDSALTNFKRTFLKFVNQRLYNELYIPYPKLKIVEDETGTKEFQESFKQYVIEHRPQNLFSQYDFDFTDSKDEALVQLADFISGSIAKTINDSLAPNYIEMLKGKIMHVENFPCLTQPYFGSMLKEHQKYDKEIFDLAIHRARAYIGENEKDKELDKQLQVALLKYLMFQVHYVNSKKYISSNAIIAFLEEYTSNSITKDFLYRKIIAPLRDASVILASCNHGYKIPISTEDIITYLNQTHTVVSPMLNRIEICRRLIKEQTANSLDIFDDKAFIKYKKYFD